jgi:hypothetical protein
MALEYIRNESITSGARYHRVATSRNVNSHCKRSTRALTFCESSLCGIGRSSSLRTSCKTKVTDFQIAVGIQEEIGRFEISVDDCDRE